MERLVRMAGIGLLLALFLVLVAAPAWAKTKVTIATHYQPLGAFQLLQDAIDEYNGMQNRVEIEHLVFEFDELRAKLMVMHAAGVTPDIVHIPHLWLPELALNGMVRPVPNDVQQVIENAYLPGALGLATFRGKLYGFPTENMPRVLVYNENVFDEFGVASIAPESWAELRDYARKLTRVDSDGNYEMYGFGLWTPAVPLVGAFMGLAWSNGGEPIDEARNKAQLTAGSVIDAAQFLHDLFQRDRAAVLGWPFREERLAMYISFGPWERDLLIRARGDDWYETIGSWQVPAGRNGEPVAGQHGWLFAVSQPSKVSKEAYAFLGWLNTKATANDTTRMGDLLANLGSVPTTRIDMENQPLTRERYMQAFVEAAVKGYTRPDPLIPRQNDVYAVLQGHLRSMLQGEVPLRNALETANRQIQQILDDTM